MECREAERLVQSYIRGELEGKKYVDFIEHIKSCDECYDELEIYYTVFHGLNQLESGDYVEMQSNLNKKLQLEEQKIYRARKVRVYKIMIELLAAFLICISLVYQVHFWIYGNDSRPAYMDKIIPWETER